jgi:hypothetical protein
MLRKIYKISFTGSINIKCQNAWVLLLLYTARANHRQRYVIGQAKIGDGAMEKILYLRTDKPRNKTLETVIS